MSSLGEGCQEQKHRKLTKRRVGRGRNRQNRHNTAKGLKDKKTCKVLSQGKRECSGRGNRYRHGLKKGEIHTHTHTHTHFKKRPLD